MKTSMEVNLPNGVHNDDGLSVFRDVEIRALTGYEEDMLRATKGQQTTDVVNRLLKSCITRLGPHETKEAIAAAYDKGMLMADSNALLLWLRQLSIGPDYSFDAQCPYCDHHGRHTIDISTMRCTTQPEEFRGLRSIQTVVQGTAVTFRPLYARDLRMLDVIRTQYPEERATRELLLQIIDVEGEKPPADVVKKWTWAFRNALRKAMDDTLGGIDTTLVMECARCDRTFKSRLPLELKDFFFPVEDTSKPRRAIPFHVYGQIAD